MDGLNIQEVASHKHLGIYFSSNGSWHDHINYIVKKAYNRVNFLRRVRFVLDRYVLERMYFSYIRPILEYGDVVWHNYTQYLVNKLESVQIDAMRIVTGGTKLTSLEKLYQETGWEKLSARREKHRLIQLYKIINKESPNYLWELVPSSIGDRHSHFTRQVENIVNVRTRTNFYSEYFLPATINMWNNLPLDVRKSTSLSIFKNKLVTRSKETPKYYYVGTRKGQILHARLRMNSSSLNEHLFLRNLVDSPKCTCGHVESTYHFLFECYKYDQLRYSTIHTLNLNQPVDVNLLLYGSDLLTLDENINVFNLVQKYIVQSKRFF